MNLKELQAMIKEELDAYVNEADDMPDVAVSDDDVDADGEMDSKDAMDTLRKIYDMLKDKFEAEEDMGDDEEADEDMMGEVKDDEEKKEWQPEHFGAIQITIFDYTKQDELVDEEMWKDGKELYDWWGDLDVNIG